MHSPGPLGGILKVVWILMLCGVSAQAQEQGPQVGVSPGAVSQGAVSQEAVSQGATAPPPQVGISPSRFELEVGDQSTVQSLRVINLGDQSLEVEVSVANWEMDENNQVVVVEPTEQSLDQWMLINPLRFSIAPQQTQTVRFSIRPRVEPTPGEHRAMIYLNQILPEAPEGAGLRFRFEYGVAVYGYVGEVVRDGTLHGIEVAEDTNPPQVFFDVSSTGTAHLRLSGQYAVWPCDVYPGEEHTQQLAKKDPQPPPGLLQAGNLPLLPVLPGDRRKLLLELPGKLPPGDYILDLNGELGGQAIDRGILFTIPGEGPP